MDAKFQAPPRRLMKIITPLLPPNAEKPLGGRPPLANERALAGIFYRLRTGCQWKALPRVFGSGSAVHRRFQSWVDAGIFAEIYKASLEFYGIKKGFKLKWASVDAASVKAPKGGP